MKIPTRDGDGLKYPTKFKSVRLGYKDKYFMSCIKKYGLKPAKEAQNGRFQKIAIPIPPTAFRISKWKAGFTIMEFWWHGGGGRVFMTGNPKAWGNSTGGISGVESVE